MERLYRAAASLAFGGVWLAAWAGGRSRGELGERRGFVPDARAPLLWFHGASAGEVRAAVNLARALRESGLDFAPAFTATNRAGIDMAARAGGERSVASLVPWEAPRWLGRAFARWSPRALFLVETELWPGLITEADRRGVPVFCVSARVYPRDVLRYRWIRPLVAAALRRVTLVAPQDEIERERLLALGAPPERCVVGGNLKYLGAQARASDAEPLRAELGVAPGDPIVTVGSVHHDEVELVLTALAAIPSVPWRAIVAPRHASAVDRILEGARRRGCSAARRTEIQSTSRAPWRILALDTIGELASAYALARVAVVGGGFARHGGHDPFEAIAAGTPVLFGENMDHFAKEARTIAGATPEAVAKTAHDVARGCRLWLEDRDARERALGRQSAVLPDATAIGRRYVELLSEPLRRALDGRRG